MKKTLVLTVILSLILTTALIAQPGPGMRGYGDCRMGEQNHPGFGGHMKGRHQNERFGIQRLLRLGDELNLTDDQQTKLEDMMLKFQLEQVDKKAELKKEQIKLRTLMRDFDADEYAVSDGIDKVARLKADMKKMKYSNMKQARNILTDEQIDKLKTLRNERRDKFQKGFQGGLGHPGRSGRVGR